VCTAATLLGSSAAHAQQPAWQPERLPSRSTAARLVPGSSLRTQANHAVGQATSETEQLGSGVALRWKKPNSGRTELGQATASPSATSEDNSLLVQQAYQQPSDIAASSAFQNSEVRQASDSEPRRIVSGSANPLRDEAWVRSTNYQEQSGNGSIDPFAEPPPVFPGLQNSTELQEGLPAIPNMQVEGLPPPTKALDPLEAPELAPAPSTNLDPSFAPSPFVEDEATIDARGQDASPFDRTPSMEGLEPQADLEGVREELAAPKRNKTNTNLMSCNEQRNRAKDLPLRDISLDVSPAYGEGLRSILKDTEQERLDFAASSEVRDWSDYTGMIVASGRLVDLRNDRVILDVNGSERSLLLQDLSDVDVAYVGESWNLPTTCGTGYERFVGRNFIPSTVQWTASGLCNKPLYFEQVQLERYGHEAGPIIQPLVSTAHFFGNIAILPYKMGIHPPNECQYSLGYIRPGNCAPYMMQPIPWSLRGALVQAGAVTGAAALIP
jgi:hypothetical protein